jgi:hypothetical protein
MLLSNFKTTDKTITANIASLKAILEDTEYKTTATAIKPLYKSLLQLSLSENEKRYFAKIPAFKQQIDNLKHDQLQESLAAPLELLCNKGMALTEKEFAKVMELPDTYRPFIVYNQVAALYNDDLEENELEIVAIIKKYEWHFFQIPEAVFLFAQLFNWDTENFSPNFFWKNIESSLERFGTSFTSLQLNRLSWQIYYCLDDPSVIEKKIHTRRFNQLIKRYPQMLGLKWAQITEHIFSPSTDLYELSLDLFSYANFNHGAHIVKQKWDQALDGMYPDSGFYSVMIKAMGMDDMMVTDDQLTDHLNNIYIDLLGKVQNVLIRATTEYKVHLKNKVVLDLFKITNKYINKLEDEIKKTLDKQKKEKFFEAYYQMIVLFEEDQAGSEYMHDYKSLENAPKIMRLNAVIKARDGKEKELIALLEEHIKVGESYLVHQVLIDSLLYFEPVEEIQQIVISYFKLLINQTQVDLGNIIEHFAKLYIKEIRLPHVPNFPDSQYFNFLKLLMKGNTSPSYILTISTLTKNYLPFITREVTPLYYNAAEQILSYFIKTKKKNPNFEYDQEMLNALIDFIEKPVKQKKLKKLGATLEKAKITFQ